MSPRFVKSQREMEGRFEDVWVLVDEDDDLETWPDDAELAVVGRPATRHDGPLRASGAARYTVDVALPGMLHARVLRAPVARCRVTRIDVDSARSTPGVRGVLGPEGPFTMNGDPPLTAEPAWAFFCGAVGLGLGLGYLLKALILPRQLVNRLPAVWFQPRTYRFDADGVSWSSSVGRSWVSWAGFGRVAVRPFAYLLWQPGGLAVWDIPRAPLTPEQVDALVRRSHEPFATAVGIGAAGERVARQLHARTGWFPAIARVEVTREERGEDYVLSTRGAPPLEQQLAGVAGAASLAIVDDTVFSGLTMKAVLKALPPDARRRAHVFCLRAVHESLADVATLCPASAGFVAEGRLLEDVSFINASGLVRRGAIRRVGAPPLAFYERPEWMKAWFGAAADEITARCAALARVLPDL